MTWRRIPRVVGYAYDADVHCVACTLADFHRGAFQTDGGLLDENGLPVETDDSEGNRVSPIFSTDDAETCGDCGRECDA